MNLRKYIILVAIALLMVTVPNAQENQTSNDAVIVANTENEASNPIIVELIPTLIGANAWHNEPFNYRGQGQHIAILDHGFAGIEELEVNYTIVKAPILKDKFTTRHGTNVLRIAAEIAPEATFYICDYDLFATYSSCVEYFKIAVDNGPVDIIIHAAGIPNQPLDGISDWSRLAEEVYERHDILWINAAGNFAQGVLTTNFVRDDRQGASDPSLNLFRIGTTRDTRIVIVPTSSNNNLGEDQQASDIILVWQGKDGNPAQNYDLELLLYDEQGRLIRPRGLPEDQNRMSILSTELIENRNLYGIQKTLVINRPIFIEVRDKNNGTAQDIQFTLLVEYANFEDQDYDDDSILAPADSGFVITVGALDNSTQVAEYSSFGTMASGNVKPNLVSFGSIVIDGESFIGTSAAASIVGGAAALIRQAFPEDNAEQISNYLYKFATENEGLRDNSPITYGEGRLFLPTLSVGASQPSELANPLDPPLDPNQPTIIVRNSDTAIRFGPSSSCSRVQTAETGTSFSVYQVSTSNTGEYDWYQVQVDDTSSGWIYSGNVQVLDSINSETLNIEFVAISDACPVVNGDTASNVAQTDRDNDLVPDPIDECPEWGNIGAGVAANGCPFPNPNSGVNPTAVVNPTVVVNPTAVINPTAVVNPTEIVNPTAGVNPTAVVNPTAGVNPTEAVNPTAVLSLDPNGDEDDDNVKNRNDDCPYDFGPPRNRGCPEPDISDLDPNGDEDGDNVKNRNDDCPYEFGLPRNGGCPE